MALSSGGARGFAHVGVLKALRGAGLQVATVVGSSMGGIMAAGYAVRGDIAELEGWVLDFRAREHMRRVLPVMDSERITTFLDRVLDGARFADCAVPLAIVATDLERREPATLTDGPVALAIAASMAMPFLHRPVSWQGRRLAEAALSCPLPVAQARAPGIELVIGSMVSQGRPRFEKTMGNLSGTVGRVLTGWQRQYVDFFRARDLPVPGGDLLPDPAPPVLVVTPELGRIGALDFHKVREAIAAGERAVAARLDEIRAALGLG